MLGDDHGTSPRCLATSTDRRRLPAAVRQRPTAATAQRTLEDATAARPRRARRPFADADAALATSAPMTRRPSAPDRRRPRRRACRVTAILNSPDVLAAAEVVAPTSTRSCPRDHQASAGLDGPPHRGPRPRARRRLAELHAASPRHSGLGARPRRLDLVTGLATFVEGKSRRQPAADAAVGLRPGLPADPGRRRRERAAGHDERPPLLPRAHRTPGRRRAPWRPQPAGPRRLVGRGRDPATLSGGETFVVSLALALGPGRRGHRRGRRRRRSTPSSSTRASAPSTPTPSTT